MYPHLVSIHQGSGMIQLDKHCVATYQNVVKYADQTGISLDFIKHYFPVVIDFSAGR